MKKTKIILNGAETEAEYMEFHEIPDCPGKYELDDETIFNIKFVVSEVYKLPTTDPLTGLPNLLIKTQNIVSVEPPWPEEK